MMTEQITVSRPAATNGNQPQVQPMIEAQNLVKTFGKVQAVKGVSFSVAPGEVFGLLGHNGAGKTTIIKMLTGQLIPTSGTARISGLSVTADPQQASPMFGIVFEEQNLYERLSANENLAFNANLYGVPNAKQRIAQVLAQVGLGDSSKRAVSTYSTGMKQRLLIARAILHQPRVLFLDEPTRGLDPASAQELRNLIKELSAQGTTVLITTHYMEDAEQLCQRLAFMSNGEVIALDTPYNLKIKYGENTITANIRDGAGERRETFRMGDPASAQQFAALLAGNQIVTAHTDEATLEEVFIKLSGRSLL